MPLDTRKCEHIQTVVTRTFAARQKGVVFVYQSSASYSYSIVNVVFRPQHVVDPQIPDSSGIAPRAPADMLMVAPLGTSFSSVIYVADTATATAAAVQAAQKYEIIEVVPVGIIVGGTHLVALLRRMR